MKYEGIKKGDGWLKNGIRLGISLFGSYVSLENKKKRIRRKYRNKQFIWSTLITIVLLVWSYFYVMKPSAEIEVNIENKMQQQVKEHFDNLNIWVATELNIITKEL